MAVKEGEQSAHRRKLARIYEDAILAEQAGPLLMSEVIARAREALYAAGVGDASTLRPRPRFGIQPVGEPTCGQCGQALAHRDAASVAYFVENSGEPRKIAVPGSFHSGDCASQALMMFGRAFRMGQLTAPREGGR